MEEDLIYRNLKKMNTEEDRAIYREVSKVFHEVVLYNRAMLKELSDRIDQEKGDQQGKLYICGTAAKKEDVPLADHLFYPVSLKEETRPDFLITLFFEYTKEKMEQLFAASHRAVIEMEDGSYEALVRLIPSVRYIEEVEELERQFYHNKILFGNMNLPYLYKFADVVLETSQEAAKRGSIRRIMLEGHEEAAKSGIIPLWNVKKSILPCAMFPVPAVDKAYYEHIITMPDQEDGYVVKADPDIARVFYRDDTIVIWTELEKAKKWEVYRIVSPSNKNISIPHWKVTTNGRRMSHSDRQAESAVRLPRTKAELFRILSSYQACVGISFGEDLRTAENKDSIRETIKEKITVPGGRPRTFEGFDTSYRKPVIIISFSAEGADFTLREQISFLLGELACFFPEYDFEGELC